MKELKCPKCNTCIKEELDTKVQDWYKIIYFLDFLYKEAYIEEGTYNTLTEATMTFKSYAFDWERNRMTLTHCYGDEDDVYADPEEEEYKYRVTLIEDNKEEEDNDKTT